MKRNSKILAVIAAIAMLASFIAMPASADASENTVYTWDFEENNPVNSVQSSMRSNCEANTVKAHVYEGTQSLKIINKTIYRAGICAGTAETGVKYMLSCYAKAGSSSTSVRIRPASAYAGTNETANRNTVSVDVIKNEYTPVNNSGWTKITCYFTMKATDLTGATGSNNRGFHVYIETAAAKDVYVDNVVVEKVEALDFDNSSYAVKSKNAVSGAAELSLYTNTSKTVYLLSASYDGSNKLSDVSITKQELTNAAPKTLSLANVGADDKIFVWDSTLKPLNNVLVLSDFE
ncbi:MAG: hypothetical protein IJ300_06490 [Clostridia bacterium]|nr:hypothetical protein [Clostridia bacterium]